MRHGGVHATVLLGFLCFTAGAARAGEEPTWPGWLVGRWETTSAGDPPHANFEPDGTLEIGGTRDDGTPWSDSSQRWEVRGASLVLRNPSKGGATTTLSIERPPEELGRLGLRLVEPSTTTTAPVYRKVLGRPRWLIGTWVSQGAQGAERWVFLADGQVRHVTEAGSEVEHLDRGRWEERAGNLHVGTKPGPPWALELLPPDDGRLRARWRDGRPADKLPVWTRASWLPQQSYEGGLLGRWDVLGAALPTTWIFGPYGRYERRRAFDAGALVERGRFGVSRGPSGELLELESDAGYRRALAVQIAAGPSLRLTDATRGLVVEAKRLDGSPSLVAADAIDESAAQADTEATYRFLHGERGRLTAPGSAPSAPAPPSDPGGASRPDPAPDDVFAGMEAFRKPQLYRFESEQVLVREAASQRVVFGETPEAVSRAVPGSARPRVIRLLSFLPSGRVTESLDLWERDGTAPPTTVLHYGKYGLHGDVVLVQFEGGPEARWRLGEAGRFLYRGEATFMAVPAWQDMDLDGPKWPW